MTDKKLLEMTIVSVSRNETGYTVLRLRADNERLPQIHPGQFVNILVESSKEAFLRRPISVNDVIDDELILMVKNAGPGTEILCNSKEGDKYNVMLPLGKGFNIPDNKTLLIGGGVGIAPLLYLGKKLKENGKRPQFLLGARTVADLISIDEYRLIGDVYICTEDGSEGVKGFVTNHPILRENWDHFAVCGPMPMMKAIANVAREKNVDCEVSLENKMACGLGACLCCVEDTVRGNECSCTQGPVFNLNDLKW